MATLTLYGSNAASAVAPTTACELSTTTGGTAVNVTTTLNQSKIYGEQTSKGLTVNTVSTIPTTPTGNGWVYSPGAGSFANATWTAKVTIVTSATSTSNTIRFFKYSSGTYTLIGSITDNTGYAGNTTITFSATLAAATLAAGDLLYVDVWWQDNNTNAGGDNPALALSNSGTAGVTNDLQITTADFAASGGGTNYSQSVSDTQSALDASIHQELKPLTGDVISALDARLSQMARPLAPDTTSGLDGQQKQAQKPLGDTQSGQDASQKGTQKPLGDVTSGIDTVSRLWQAHLALLEAISGSDSVQKALKKYLGDTFSELDSLSEAKTTGGTAYTRAISEFTSGLDMLATIGLLKLIGDATAALDTLAKSVQLPLLENTSSLDSFQKRLQRLLSDYQSGLDSLNEQHFTGGTLYSRALLDTQSGSDAQMKAFGKQWYDETSAQDALAWALVRLLQDELSLTDTNAKSLARLVAEQVSATDKVAAGRVFLVTLLEQTGLFDTSMTAFTRAQYGALALVASLVAQALGISINLVQGTGALAATLTLLSGDLAMLFSITLL